MDREKVIKGLECRAYDNDFPCGICAYYKRDDEHAIPYCDYRGLMDDALALLKEQEAKPVEVCGQMFTIKYGHCPTCGKGMDSDTYPRWCGFCGQEVKWK